MNKQRPMVLMCVVLMATTMAASAANLEFSFQSSTPVGSWQEREQVTTDQKGKQTVLVMRISYLGDEEREGEVYAWIETEMNSYHVKKNDRKQQGDTIYTKVLMKKSILQGDIANAVNDFNGLATEVIMQTGQGQPMRIKGADSMMTAMAQTPGLKVNYELSNDGAETVTVPAGTFSCNRYKGKGTTTAKVIFKTMTVESTVTQWISSKVPFGVVKVVSDDLVNGEQQHTQITLTSFGSSGATSKITGEPQDLPSMGDIFGR